LPQKLIEMTEIATITLENEMDLVLAHKRSMKVAEKLGLTVATQTTFATAVSEVARTVIEQTDNGKLIIGIEQNKTRYTLHALINFESDEQISAGDEGFYYAQKLVPELALTSVDNTSSITMKIGLPRSLKLDARRVTALKQFFAGEPALSPYEEIKRRNVDLYKIAGEREEQLRLSREIDKRKTEFLSIASHEIKTPITVLKAYTQMAKKSDESISERLQGLLNKIDSQSGKLIALVQQLLDISKIENGSLQYNMEEISLNAFITDQLSVMKHILPKHELNVDLCDNVRVNIDVLRMEQVFSNILGNAAKYSPPHTDIIVKTMVGNEFVTLSFADNGRGMSDVTMKSIFNKFYRSTDVMNTHSGLGMGLFVASKIIVDHGGKIWVESTEGRGSTFYFTIPLISALN
jgi:signal transduction histidine kinase